MTSIARRYKYSSSSSFVAMPVLLSSSPVSRLIIARQSPRPNDLYQEPVPPVSANRKTIAQRIAYDGLQRIYTVMELISKW
jgi:hypothetical protein